MRFSSRVQSDLAPNEFFRAVERLRSAGGPVWDLTVSNPTLAGLDYPLAEIQAAFSEAARHAYQPDPRGLPAAREAVAAYYRGHGKSVPSDSVILTSGTSEAYGYLFKLLCEPGNAVLFPKPGYPLVELIAGLEGAVAHPYPLAGKGWRWEIPPILESLTPDARAVVAVSPNNPTGGMLTGEELRSLSGFCAAQQLALIVDEVFLDYPAPGRESDAVTSAGNPDALTFTLGGLSKACGLPQMKLAWIVVSGPAAEARDAIARLEFVADAFLSAGTPVQQAAPALLGLGARMRGQIRRRVDRNEQAMREILGPIPGIPLFPRDGGWYAVIGLPSGVEDEDFALRLLEEQRVIVQPGYLFDFEDLQTAVVSLLAPDVLFTEGVGKLADFLRKIPAK